MGGGDDGGSSCMSFQHIVLSKKRLGITFGCQFGEYSPPAPCLDFTAISSPISLVMNEHADIRKILQDAHY